MIGFENVNSRIIAGSVNQYKTSVPEVTSEQVKKQPDKSALQNKQTKEKTEHARAMKGATILAGIVVAGIAVTKFRGPVIRMIKGAAKKGGDINNSSARNNSGFVGNNNDPMTEIKSYTVDQYKKCVGCAYETARSSMNNLVLLGYYKKEILKKKFVYIPVKRN